MAYLYRHIRHDTNQVFYVGIGSSTTSHERAYDSSGRSNFWKNITKKTGYDVEIMMDDISLEYANEKEIEFIRLYGRREKGGTLVNLNDGGGGAFGNKISDEVKQKISKSLKGRIKPESERANISKGLTGIPKSKEHRLNLSIAKKGFRPSQETRVKLSEARKRRIYTDEIRLNLSLSLKGKKKSESHTRNNSIANYRLSKDQIIEIHALRKTGLGYKKIGKVFGVCAQTICNIVNGKTYKYLANG